MDPKEMQKSHPWQTDLSAGIVIAALALGGLTAWLLPVLSPIFLLNFLFFVEPKGFLREKLCGEWKFPLRFLGDALLIALGATVISAGVTNVWMKVLYGLFGLKPDLMQEIARIFLEASPGVKIALAWNILIIAPITEELIFRRLLFDLCGRFLPRWGAFVLTALLFSLAHRHLASVAGLFCFGLILQAFYQGTRNLLVPVAIHIFFNGIALIGLLLFT